MKQSTYYDGREMPCTTCAMYRMLLEALPKGQARDAALKCYHEHRRQDLLDLLASPPCQPIINSARVN